MSRLLNPGVGEVCDRLTILALKILHGQTAGRPTEHFERERAGLLTKLRAQTLNGSWFEHVLELGVVNGALWQAEDRLREIRSHATVCWEHAGIAGVRIQELNDRRAQLVAKINELAGEAVWEEKL